MIYYISDGQNIKVGFTDGTIEARLKQLQTGNPHKLRVLATEDGDLSKEKARHLQFQRDLLYNEWFSGDSEELLEHINSISKYYCVFNNRLEEIVIYNKMKQ